MSTNKHTHIIEGERQWTNESIENILHAWKYNEEDPDAVHDVIKSLLRDSLKEAGFFETITQDQLNAWSFKVDKWACYIKLIKTVDKGCVVLIGVEKYDIGDLIYLWDKIRMSWRLRSL